MRPTFSEDHDAALPLHGGRLTARVLRIGCTVRRQTNNGSEFTGRLLDYLQEQGFRHVPRYLGQDQLGFQVFEFIEGWVPEKFQHFADFQVRAAGRLLRDFHKATAGFNTDAPAEIVCHNDPGPNNTVFVNGLPSSFIDFDTAATGEAINDLAYMGWTWCISSKYDRLPLRVQARQLRVLTDGYGFGADARRRLLPEILERQYANTLFWKNFPLVENSKSDITRALAKERSDWSNREMDFTYANQEALMQFL